MCMIYVVYVYTVYIIYLFYLFNKSLKLLINVTTHISTTSIKVFLSSALQNSVLNEKFTSPFQHADHPALVLLSLVPLLVNTKP